MTDKHMCDCNQGRLECRCKEPSEGSLTGAEFPFGVANWSVDTSKMQTYSASFARMPLTLSFANWEGVIIGQIKEIEDGSLEFSGNLQESAKSLFENMVEPYHAKLSNLKDEIAALRKDAERYRWMRDRHNDSYSNFTVTDEGESLGVGPNFFDINLDAGIDAMMSK